MATADENTPLLGSETLVDRSSPRPYYKQNRKIHICAFISLLVILAVAGAATVWFLSENKNVSFTPDSRNASVNQLLNNEWPRLDQKSGAILFTPLISTIVNEAVDEGKKTLENREAIETNIDPISVDSPSYRHQYAIVNSPTGYNLSKLGYVENEATKYLQSKGYESVIDYESASTLKWAVESECTKRNGTVNCNATKYRTIDGSGNNLDHPRTWGVAMTPFRRALPANYSDGVSEPRGGFVTTLPSARDVSTLVHRPVHREDEKFTVMLAVWGQFIDHDITATALSRGANGTTISCCNVEFKHPECFPVLLNETDEYYNKYNLTCMEFVRSAPALRCSFGPREQLNQVSSYLDASMIYGNTETLAYKLRSFKAGLLEMSYTNDGRPLLPFSKDPIDGCNQAEEIKKGRYCFLSGDSRANENSHLTSIHLIFARQHNAIVKKLSILNPHWNDETLYQEARRIVAAQVQHITYNEFLSIIIGHDLMSKLKLYPLRSGHWDGYNSSVDATIANNFATSSFRFAHTLIPRMMKRLANDTSSPEYVEMHKMLFNPFGLYEGDLDAIIKSAIDTDIEKADNYFNTELTEHLFENKKSNYTYGLDLVALNIQRGRDHGLPTYPHWREYCGFPRVSSFEELSGVFDEQSLEIISSIYKNVDDIDLYTGSLSEYPIEGGLVGPTLTCLITDQFFRLKYGDRYWYETKEGPQAFTEDQLNEIRKTSLAGILCQNADDLDYITPQVMKSNNTKNIRIRCSDVPQPDLTVFQDRESNDSLPRFKISDVHIETNNLTAAWNGSIQIPHSYVDKLAKNGISWKSVISDDDNIARMNGSFSFPDGENQTIGRFEIKYDDQGLSLLPNDTQVWSPVYTSDSSVEWLQANETNFPIILFGNKTSDEFQWNGNFSVITPKTNISKQLNAEIVDYLPTHEYNSKSKRARFNVEEPEYHVNSTSISEQQYPYFSNEDPSDVLRIFETNEIPYESSPLKKNFNETPLSYVTESVKPILNHTMKFANTSEVQQYFPEIFKLQPLISNKNTTNETMNTYETTLVTEKLDIKSDDNKSYEIAPPVKLSSDYYSDKMFTWRWSPETNSILGNFTGNQNGTFELKYKTTTGHTLIPNCVYYSKMSASPDFNYTVDESDGCSRIAPISFDGLFWLGNVTITTHDLPANLEKENDLSLNPKEERYEFKNVSGTVSIALNGEDVLLWNNTLPAVFEPKLSWFKTNDTVAYPVSWSGFYSGSTFIGSFLFPEKQDGAIFWHEGKFSINLGDNATVLETIQVYTAVVYLTTKDDVILDLTDLEEISDWNLNQYARVILKGTFIESKFYWYGELIFIMPKIVDDSVSSTYRPYIRYAGKVLDGTLYAQLNGPKYLWWSGEMPSTVLIPAETPRGYKHIFDQVILWTYTAVNSTIDHALFVTYGNQSRISLSGSFDFEIESLLNSPKLSENTTYYSPIVLQQNTYDFSDDILDAPSNDSLGVFAPITLLGKYLPKERLFAWNGKFIISVID